MVVRSRSDVQGLRRANRATARLLGELTRLARPGLATRELDDHARDYIARLGAEPVFHTEAGFPGCINTSVNEVALHGVPGKRRLRDGDVLSIDAGMLLDGYCGDATITVAIGEVGPARRRLIATTRGAMEAGIGAAVAGNRVGDIGHAMQSFAESRGFSVLRGVHGHGLGHRMHEAPEVPFVGRQGTGPVLPKGLVITIEPILVERSPRLSVDEDGWTMRTVDGGWAAQFEHTVIVTRRGARILSVA
ncbi:MAG: Methionine aminopeptidase [uncultured Thermomicrobiales bacterium]|uniref:Methionine aminopeptidase n=1 Tax=uncultured Thermomicrobiales bacterium TaxID=1645740 RepID=A0A6J4UD32_9BACT|nr:MAG: Methionine aminopeptidase [uncultured Thermomicrobiales bacterium]